MALCRFLGDKIDTIPCTTIQEDLQGGISQSLGQITSFRPGSRLLWRISLLRSCFLVCLKRCQKGAFKVCKVCWGKDFLLCREREGGRDGRTDGRMEEQKDKGGDWVPLG